MHSIVQLTVPTPRLISAASPEKLAGPHAQTVAPSHTTSPQRSPGRLPATALQVAGRGSENIAGKSMLLAGLCPWLRRFRRAMASWPHSNYSIVFGGPGKNSLEILDFACLARRSVRCMRCAGCNTAAGSSSWERRRAHRCSKPAPHTALVALLWDNRIASLSSGCVSDVCFHLDALPPSPPTSGWPLAWPDGLHMLVARDRQAVIVGSSHDVGQSILRWFQMQSPIAVVRVLSDFLAGLHDQATVVLNEQG